jgi:hypothetical protein
VQVGGQPLMLAVQQVVQASQQPPAFLLGLLGRGDVLVDAGHLDHPAGGVADTLGVGQDPYHRPVGTDRAELRLERRRVGARARQQLLPHRPVVGVDELTGDLAGQRGAGIHAEDAVQLWRPAHAVGGEVPFPAPDAGELPGLQERLLGPMPLADVAPERHPAADRAALAVERHDVDRPVLAQAAPPRRLQMLARAGQRRPVAGRQRRGLLVREQVDHGAADGGVRAPGGVGQGGPGGQLQAQVLVEQHHRGVRQVLGDGAIGRVSRHASPLSKAGYYRRRLFPPNPMTP